MQSTPLLTVTIYLFGALDKVQFIARAHTIDPLLHRNKVLRVAQIFRIRIMAFNHSKKTKQKKNRFMLQLIEYHNCSNLYLLVIHFGWHSLKWEQDIDEIKLIHSEIWTVQMRVRFQIEHYHSIQNDFGIHNFNGSIEIEATDLSFWQCFIVCLCLGARL